MTPDSHPGPWSSRNAPSPTSRSSGIRAWVVSSEFEGAVMRRAVVLVLVGVLFLRACGGDEDDAADTSAASSTAPRGEPIVIRTRMVIAAEERAEPIATGEVLEGSTLGSSPFCAGGTILDSHGSPDPA